MSIYIAPFVVLASSRPPIASNSVLQALLERQCVCSCTGCTSAGCARVSCRSHWRASLAPRTSGTPSPAAPNLPAAPQAVPMQPLLAEVSFLQCVFDPAVLASYLTVLAADSLLTAHCSLLTADSLLTAHCSLLTAHATQ